jgi:hypothetical protein
MLSRAEYAILRGDEKQDRTAWHANNFIGMIRYCSMRN